MDRAGINAFCATLPGAEVSDPWGGGHDAWKVGGKMFASLGALTDGVSVKCASVEAADMLIDAGIARRAPYFHRSWVHLDPGSDPDELRHRIAQSYALIRAGLPKRVQAGMPPAP
jgi:predicted DNA-binding protein (MmcQ/YjbR family)